MRGVRCRESRLHASNLTRYRSAGGSPWESQGSWVPAGPMFSSEAAVGSFGQIPYVTASRSRRRGILRRSLTFSVQAVIVIVGTSQTYRGERESTSPHFQTFRMGHVV